MPEVHESLRELTIQELAEKRAELMVLHMERDDLDLRIAVLERQAAYAKPWDRQKFAGDVQPRRGPKRKGGITTCVQCGRDFYLRPYDFKRNPPFRFCSVACLSASGTQRESGRRGGLEAWRRHPNMRPASKRVFDDPRS